ncbi:MAG TPA: serine/threonine-protein kinase, partial [Terriglobales bacterium]
ARLQHPGIAQIYESGTADSGFGPQPYFAMEFVQGRPLTAYADEHHLEVRSRLELMAKVCDAVNHAHQRGIIHRDLKPGNILVDDAGQPKILDFGVARVTDSDAQATQQTDLGQLVGTLAYMSPEQALANPLDLDLRSDVYTLGVILYELLAGKLPYNTKHNALHEVVRAIREEDPTSLAELNRGYRGDIETIVTKALEKDKARRYASAADLAADIRRHLTDQPIQAQAPSARYQLQKFARRHRALVVSTAVVFMVLMAGIVVSTREASRARTAERTALAINDFLERDLLSQSDSERQSGTNRADPDLKVRTALDRAATRITGKFDQQPEVEASIRDTIGQTYINLGLHKEARPQLERALELRRRVLGVEHPKTLETLFRIGSLTLVEGKYAQAETIFSQALDSRRRVLGPEDPSTLESMMGLANNYRFQGKYAQAEALSSQTLEIQRRVLGPEHRKTLETMNILAVAYYMQGKYVQAEALYSQTLEAQRRVLSPEHPSTLRIMNNLAGAYYSQGKYMQAETLHSETLEIRRRVLGPEHPETLSSMSNLAETFDSRGKYEQAEALYSQTLEIRRRVLGPEHPSTLLSMMGLANNYRFQGKYAQAEALSSQTLEIQRRVLGPEHPYTLNSMNNLASVYYSQGKYVQAEALFGQTLAAQRRVSGPEHPETLESMRQLAAILVHEGKYAASEALAREALGVDRSKRPDAWERFDAECLLGVSLAGQRKYADAEPLLLEGYRGMESRQDRIAAPERYLLDRAREWIAQLYDAWDKPEKAGEWRKH